MTTAAEAGRVRARIEEARARFRERVEVAGREARQLLLPYFQSRGWRLVRGFVFDARGSQVRDDQLPRWILRLLTTEVARDDYLDSYISDIRRRPRLSRATRERRRRPRVVE